MSKAEIVLSTFGSAGDFQPFLALAIELQRLGYNPVIAAAPNFAPHAARLGIDFREISPRLDSAEIRTILNRQIGIKDPIEHARGFLEAIGPLIPSMFQKLCAVCKNADVLVSSPYQPALQV